MMDLIRDQIKNPIAIGIIGFVAGLLLGWLVIGYWIWPVEWTDAATEHLRADLKEDYLRMVIDSNVLHPDPAKAQERWDGLQPGAEEALAAVDANPGIQANDLPNFKSLVQAEAVAPLPDEVEGGEEGEGGSNYTFLLVMCLVTIILGGALAAYFLFRPGRSQDDAMSPAAEAQRVSRDTPQTDFAAREGGPPMSQFMTTYMLGDDLFDDSFSIDSPTGEFLGECGVGISESVGVGEPKKVTAFEVWLFDKNDIQTITRVLMSHHAFSDNSLRTRLAAKGDPFLMETGNETELETATLRLVARVVDMAYGTGASPTDSYFERVTLELAVWQNE
jgi:hypothetical protein